MTPNQSLSDGGSGRATAAPQPAGGLRPEPVPVSTLSGAHQAQGVDLRHAVTVYLRAMDTHEAYAEENYGKPGYSTATTIHMLSRLDVLRVLVGLPARMGGTDWTIENWAALEDPLPSPAEPE